MKHPHHLRMHSVLLACALATAFSAVQAAGTGATTTSTVATPTTAVGTSENTEAKLSTEFAGFLGGEEQAHTVVSGLRQSTAFSLTQTTTDANGASTTTTATIDPPTGTMGYGNVRITLRLAQAELAQLGITQPTPEQLSAILVGGEVNGSQVNGILAMRADGMGWGQIAQQYGVSVGQIMGNGAGLAKQPATSTEVKTTGKPSSASGPTAKQTPAAQAHSNGYIPSGKAAGAGIVTGTGSSVGGSGNGGGKDKTSQASAKGAGVVSAGGQAASSAGVSNAGGKGNEPAPGQSKKN